MGLKRVGSCRVQMGNHPEHQTTLRTTDLREAEETRKLLGFDSPFFSNIVLSKNRIRFPRFSRKIRIPERMDMEPRTMVAH